MYSTIFTAIFFQHEGLSSLASFSSNYVEFLQFNWSLLLRRLKSFFNCSFDAWWIKISQLCIPQTVFPCQSLLSQLSCFGKHEKLGFKAIERTLEWAIERTLEWSISLHSNWLFSLETAALACWKSEPHTWYIMFKEAIHKGFEEARNLLRWLLWTLFLGK